MPGGPDPELDVREHLAAERTLLAYIRTGLALMGFGFVVARFGLLVRALEGRQSDLVDAPPAAGAWFGVALVVLGSLSTAAAGCVYRRELARLNRRVPGAEAYPPSRLAVALAYTLAAIGAALVAYLALTN